MYRNGIRNYFFRACCAVCAIAITPVGTGLRVSAQTPSKDLSFEVAVVKPVLMDASHPLDPAHHWAHVSQTRASYWDMSVGSLIEYAYDIEPNQVTGPDWANHDRFDIEAKFPEGANKQDDRRMLQALLKERFKLAFHTEKRELEGYALVVGKHGEKLKPSLPDPVSPEPDTPSKPGDSYVAQGPAKSEITKNSDGSSTLDRGKKGTQTIKFDPATSAIHLEVSKMTMEELAGRLGICLGSGYHKIVDKTGIRGNYQVAYDCANPRPRLRGGTDAAGLIPPDPQDGFLLSRSLDALGLKLEKRKMLMDVYIIDHVEQPSGN